MAGYRGAFFYLFIFKEQISIKGYIFCVWLFVSQLGPTVWCLAGKRTTLVQLPTLALLSLQKLWFMDAVL